MKKSILVTGASGNLGSVVVKRLTAAGYHLLAPASSPSGAAALQNDGVDSDAVDLTNEQAVQHYLDHKLSQYDISAAVFLVGGFLAGGLLETNGADLKKMFALNFETAFYPVKALLPAFEKRKAGQFILIGSRPSLVAADGKNLVAYSLSKNLVFHLAELINAYGKGKGIDATVIVPSTIDTPANRQAMPDADPAKWVSPDAIADTIQFVLSESGTQLRESTLKLYNEA